nr:MAG TPA: hypothetical protein [Caudoviricetes sp.]
MRDFVHDRKCCGRVLLKPRKVVIIVGVWLKSDQIWKQKARR